MGRIANVLKSMKSLSPKKGKSAAKLEKRALDRWENEGGPPAPSEPA